MSPNAPRSATANTAEPRAPLMPERTHSPMTNRTTPPVVDGPVEDADGCAELNGRRLAEEAG
jgi:hypothetical protein